MASPALVPSPRMQADEQITTEPAYQRVKLAADFCDVSVSTIYRMEKAKLIRIVRSGGRTLVDMASLRAYFARLPSRSER